MPAVATKVEPHESEVCRRMRQAITDVHRHVRHPNRAELTQALGDLERHWGGVTSELVHLSKPLTPSAPDVRSLEPREPSPEAVAQQQAIDAVCKLLESARAARSQALIALFRLG